MRRSLWLAVVVIFVACEAPDCLGNPSRHQPGQRREAKDPGRGRMQARVTDVTDGDTIRVQVGGQRERVRYIGIDTPEVHERPEPFGMEATEANRRLVGGSTVWLELGRERRDDYGRLLAYVYLEDGTFVNAELVRRGWAETLEVPPNTRHASLFRRLERKARDARRGRWQAR